MQAHPPIHKFSRHAERPPVCNRSNFGEVRRGIKGNNGIGRQMHGWIIAGGKEFQIAGIGGHECKVGPGRETDDGEAIR